MELLFGLGFLAFVVFSVRNLGKSTITYLNPHSTDTQLDEAHGSLKAFWIAILVLVVFFVLAIGGTFTTGFDMGKLENNGSWVSSRLRNSLCLTERVVSECRSNALSKTHEAFSRFAAMTMMCYYRASKAGCLFWSAGCWRHRQSGAHSVLSEGLNEAHFQFPMIDGRDAQLSKRGLRVRLFLFPARKE